MKRIALVLPLLAVAACGSSDGDVSVDGAWARASAAGQTTGAVYFELSVAADDRLLGASVPDDVAGDAQVHEVVAADDESMGDMDEGHDMDDESMGDMDEGHDMDDESMGDMDEGDDMGGAMRMQELTDGLALTAGETVVFEPGSYHVMLVDLAGPLEVGDEIELTLDFEAADDVTITVPVAETAP